MACVAALLARGEVRKAAEAARTFLTSIPKEASGTRLAAYALLLQAPQFTMKDGQEKILHEALTYLRGGDMRNPEARLAAAWLLTAGGGEIAPEERQMMLAAAEPFHKQRAEKRQKVMAMTIVAAHADDTDAAIDLLRSILAEGDERAIDVAFTGAARRFVMENQDMGNRFLQEAVDQAPSVRLRDRLKRVRTDLHAKQATAAYGALDRMYRELCEAERTGTPAPSHVLSESLEQYRLLCGVSSDLRQKAQAAFSAGLIAWKCGDTHTARGLHAVALDRMELLVSEGHVNPADPAMRHVYDWSAYWRKVRE
ncbi:hypothetical protein HYS30_02730 [Candidatus Peregrinibacteria bacterium]|nr:hypothetical protein [Candidatus Peregrinibacteria bacterium]